MAGRALTEDAVRAGLADIRLPGTAPGGAIGELLAALALGLALALVLGLVIRVLTRLRRRTGAEDLGARIADLHALPDDARRLALLHLLRAERPEVLAGWADRLYRPGAAPTIAEIELALSGQGGG